MSNSAWSKATSWLGLNGEEAATYPQAAAAPAPSRAQNVTRLISQRPRRGYSDMSEIRTFQPASFADSKDIAATFREGTPVIINIQDLSSSDASKMLYFILGLKEGLEGNLKRVTATVYLLGPNHVAVSDEDEEDPVIEDRSDDLLIRP